MEGGGGEVQHDAGTYNMAYPMHVCYLSHLQQLILLTDHDPHIPVIRPNPQMPFNMEEFMHMSSSYDLDKVIRMAEYVLPIPRHVPSERTGGESRREILKSRAKNISRSV